MFETNVQLTTAILDYCRRDANLSRQLRRTVVFGSSSEHGRKLGAQAESDALAPEIYEGTKAAATLLARSYEETKAAATLLARSYSFPFNIPIVVIRPFTFYGPRKKSSKSIPILLGLPICLKVYEGVYDYVFILYLQSFEFLTRVTSSSTLSILELVFKRQNIDVVKCVKKLN